VRRIGFLLVVFCAALVPASAAAEGGIPDPSFGAGGLAMVNTAPPEEREAGNAIAIDSQDRVLVGGVVNNNNATDPDSGWMLVRFRADGTLDTGFGDAGFARAPGLFGPNIADFGAAIRALAMVPGTNKVIAGGVTKGPSGSSEFTIARYNADGSLDLTFGPADTGFVRANVSADADNLEDMTVSADGSITASGSAGLNAALARWDSDGALDPSFDGPGAPGNGMFTDSVSPTFDSYRSVEVGPSGQVWAAGATADVSQNSWLIGSYTATGARDTSFNGTGIQTVAFGGSDVAAGLVPTGGALYVFGQADTDPSPAKTTLDFGVDAFRLDTGEEIPGAKGTVGLPEGRNMLDTGSQHLNGLAAPAAERFLIAGSSSTLVRLRRVGGDSATLELDPEFGSGGFAPKFSETGSWKGVATDSENRVVAGGEVGRFESAEFAAARFVDVPSATDTTAPVISNASIAPRAWALKPRGAVEALLSKKKKAKKGTKIRYTLSEPARVVVRIERRKVKKRKGKKRISFVAVGSFAKAGAAGANSNPFSGRIGKKKLKPGRYRAALVASDTAGNSSATTRLPFKVVRRVRR
jgi:uncharacterized delta-60 repeat protein